MDNLRALLTTFYALLDGNYILVGTLGLLFYSAVSHFSKMGKILSVGSDLPVLSLWGTFRYVTDAQALLDAGMKKWPRKIFKVPTPTGWEVVLTDPSVIDEVRKAPDNIMGADEAFEDMFQTKWMFGATIPVMAPYQILMIKSQLSRSLPQLIPGLYEEAVLSFGQYIPATESWARIKVFDTIKNIVTRTSNRAFVGVPLCRDPGWIETNVKFVEEIGTTPLLLRMSPRLLRPWVFALVSKAPEYRRRVSQYLAPLVAARQKGFQNSNLEKPLDLLTWLMDEAKGEEATLPSLVIRMLFLNFGSLHSISRAIAHALFYLAAFPEYVQALREEVQEVIKGKGWTKTGLDEMYKIDSFIKETQRLNPVAMLLVHRFMLQDYTFSDGTTVPAGSTIAVSVDNAHRNAEVYPDPLRFDGFRFAKMREESILSGGNPDKKFDIVSINENYLPFGYGRHACPGRFFAACQLKLMLAHVVLNYDIKLENEGVRPPNKVIMTNYLPNPTAEVLFRERKME